MTRIRSLAVAQTCPIKGDVQANIAQHIQLIDIAAAEGTQIVLFPELSLTGYELTLASSLAFSESDARLSPLLEASALRSITAIVGAPIRIGQQLHIGAFIISPDRTTSIYTKHHLGAFSPDDSADGVVPPPEASVFQPGDCNPLVPLGYDIAAIAVCADINRPSHAQHAAARGARAYLASMFVIPSAYDGDARKLKSYAAQHSMMVALANYGAPTGGLPTAGRSAIWSEKGELLTQLPDSGAGVAVVTDAGLIKVILTP